MQPADYALDIYRGDSSRWRFRMWSDAEMGVPSDLTGVTARAQIRNAPGGTMVAQMDCTVTLPNIVEMFLPASVSHRLSINKGAWDLQLTYDSGEVNTPVGGAVTVTTDVTDSTDAPYVDHRG